MLYKPAIILLFIFAILNTGGALKKQHDRFRHPRDVLISNTNPYGDQMDSAGSHPWTEDEPSRLGGRNYYKYLNSRPEY